MECTVALVILAVVVVWLVLRSKATPAGSRSSTTAIVVTAHPDDSERADQRRVHLRRGAPRWVGADESLAVHGWHIEQPLTYVTDLSLAKDEASCIDLSLSVGTPSSDELADAINFYWPTYAQLNPNQRARYLRWMASGRTEPLQSIGYVFIFFYGLERRTLIEQRDIDTILIEVIRLLETYHELSTSFCTYLSHFLAYVVARFHLNDLDEATIRRFFFHPYCSYDDLGIDIALAWMYQRQLPLSVEWAERVVRADERTPRSVVPSRVPEEFRTLFAKKYQLRFGDGLRLKAAKRQRVIEYKWATPSFDYASGPKHVQPVRIPHVLGIPSQFKPLIDLWTECIEELKPLSRLRSREGAVNMREQYSRLPEELRAEWKHPDHEAWESLVETHRGDDGIAIVTVQDLASMQDIAEGPRLTLQQSRNLAATAQYTGFLIEPDARVTGRAYGRNELVALAPAVEASPSPLSENYAKAVRLLELGMAIATADGDVDVVEVAHLSDVLQMQFRLAPAEFRRLNALCHVLARRSPSLARLCKQIQSHLTHPQREKLLQFLVGVAASNGSLSSKELSALTSACTALGISPSNLRDLIAPLRQIVDDTVEVTRETGPAPDGERLPERIQVQAAAIIALDTHRIRSLLAETEAVSQMLSDAMREDESDLSNEAAQSSDGVYLINRSHTTTSPIPLQEPPKDAPEVTEDRTIPHLHALDRRYHGFLRELLVRVTWEDDALADLARRHGLLPANAIEAINEWAEDHLGDLLVEEEEPMRIQQSLIGGPT